MGNLIFALERLKEQALLSERLSFIIGQNPKIPAGKKTLTIAIGQCASKQEGADMRIDECPPTAGSIYRRVASMISKRGKSSP
jgi:hypothetical protein